MKALFVDACVRGTSSRTRQLARCFLNELLKLAPDWDLSVQDLGAMALQPLDAESLLHREQLCNTHAWGDPSLKPAVEFQQADAVVIAAPYWDLCFPAALKVWVERMYVRNLTFVYRDDKPVGLCRARAAVYLTTAGSPIGDNDWGTGYLRAVTQMLGIPAFFSVKAEGLDLYGADADSILSTACEEARKAAACLIRAVNAEKEQGS